MYNVAVVGCGAIGLTSALAIQARLDNVTVTIFTKDVSPNTTSDVAAGLWTPYLLQNTSPDKVLQWSKATYDYLLNMWKEGKAEEAGISLHPSTFLVENEKYARPNWLEFTLGHSYMPSDQLKKFSEQYNRNFLCGFTYTTFSWEAPTFLPFLQKHFVKNGGRIERKLVKDLMELSSFDVVVNCCGMDARELVGDLSMEAVKGQVVKVSAPWQFHTYLTDSEKFGYISTNIKYVILGGSRRYEDNLDLYEKDSEIILRNCADFMPSIKSAEFVEHQVGLRPVRDKVRLEIDTKENDIGVSIVHNYGHGGGGISVAIGCAEETAELVEKALRNKHKCKL